MRNITLLFVFFSASIVSFGQFSLLKDINQTEAGSNPQNFVEANGFVFFTVQTNDGYELWQSDGTEVGTKLATEFLINGVGDYIDDELYVFNNELYFVANINQYESFRLMKTDGFTVETVLENMPAVRFYFFNGKPHFINGSKLFKIENGSPILIKQFTTSNTSQRQVPQVINDKLLFFAKVRNVTDSSYSLEVWLSDGTEVGTKNIRTIDRVSAGFYTGSITYDKSSVLVGNKCFFVIERTYNSSLHRRELWQTDGTTLETSQLKVLDNSQFFYGSETVTNLRPYNNGIVFILKGGELWRSDGTTSGTLKLLSSYFQTNVQTNFWGQLNGELYFATGSEIDSKLWKTDGTLARTEEVKNFSLARYAVPNQFTTYNNVLYFVANYNQLWQSDGSEIGTSFVGNIPKPSSLLENEPVFINSIVSSTNKLFFSNYEKETGYELWLSEGTVNSTKLLKNIITSSNDSYSLRNENFKVKNGDFWYFSATDGQHGAELWKSDGSEAGTSMVKDLSIGSVSTGFNQLISYGEKIYFTAILSGERTSRLYESDGTDSGTVEILLDAKGKLSVNPTLQIISKNKLYFTGGYKDGFTLWVVDLLSDTKTPMVFEDYFFFFANSFRSTNDKTVFVHQSHLWTTDGTVENTVKVENNNSVSVKSLVLEFNQEIFFVGEKFIDGHQNMGFYKSNGTESGTILLKDLSSFSSNQPFKIFSKSNSRIYFSLSNNQNQVELWSSDGTSQGTKFHDVIPLYARDVIVNSSGNSFFIFVHNNIQKGSELSLWIIDSSREKLEQILNKVNNSPLLSSVNFDNKLYFNMFDEKYGSELWVTDGKSTGTYLIKDLRQGLGINSIQDRILLPFDDKLLFWAIDDTHGIEPWTYTPTICEGNRNYTIKSGSWNDVTTWSCGSIPTSTDYVIIKNGHSVVIPTEYRAYSKFISTETGAVLDIERGAVFKTDN